MRVYELYQDGPFVTNSARAYYSYILKVRAKTIRHAYWLAGNDVRATKNGAVGVLSRSSRDSAPEVYAE